MSDMATQRFTVRVPEDLGSKLRRTSRDKGRTPSDLIRLAVENYLKEEPVRGSAYEAEPRALVSHSSALVFGTVGDLEELLQAFSFFFCGVVEESEAER
jgi:hypothetical protein